MPLKMSFQTLHVNIDVNKDIVNKVLGQHGDWWVSGQQITIVPEAPVLDEVSAGKDIDRNCLKTWIILIYTPFNIILLKAIFNVIDLCTKTKHFDCVCLNYYGRFIII